MEQLERWALRVGSDIHLGRQGMDPSAVIFDGCKKFLSGDYDRLIIDTAGRVQTKIHLMQELEKMCRVARKLVGEKSLGTWLVLDATLGCNTLDQARLFSGIAPLNGLVLTKVDGSGKAGAIFSVSQELSLPIAYVSHGERDEDISPFSVDEYVRGIFHGA
jgi:fused signal recognition particle receptor